MTEQSKSPHEPAYIREAKRSASRTSLISLAVICGLVTALLVFDLVRDLDRTGPIPASIWIGFAAGVLFVGVIVRMLIRRRRSL